MRNNKVNKFIEEQEIVLLMDRIVEVLKNANIEYYKISNSPRVNSVLHEYQISNEIRQAIADDDFLHSKNLRVDYPGAGEWYDIAISGDDGLFIPINIKATKLNRYSDNVCGKLGVYYAVTGQRPDDLKSSITWEEFYSLLNDNIDYENNKDYYFLICNKNDNTDFFWSSLKRLRKVFANRANPPFQCCWRSNREFADRSNSEAVEYLLERMEASRPAA